MMENNHQTVDHKKIARYAKALGHPTRVAIMCFLAKQEQCYFGDIHEELPIAKATVSQHLKELKDAELIQGEVETPKVRYCINGTAWDEARQLFADFFGLGVHKKENCCSIMEIKILGTGCAACKGLYAAVVQAVAELGIEANVVKEEEMMNILEYNVMTLPAIVIDGKVVAKGKKLSVEQIKELLR